MIMMMIMIVRMMIVIIRANLNNDNDTNRIIRIIAPFTKTSRGSFHHVSTNLDGIFPNIMTSPRERASCQKSEVSGRVFPPGVSNGCS